MPAASRRFAALLCLFYVLVLMYERLKECPRSPCSVPDLVSTQGKEIIEHYLRELEEEGVAYMPRWSPPVVSSTAKAIPAKASKTGPDSKDHAYTTELLTGTPDGTSAY